MSRKPVHDCQGMPALNGLNDMARESYDPRRGRAIGQNTPQLPCPGCGQAGGRQLTIFR